MEIRTLKGCNSNDLLTAFNESFSGYFVPLQLTLEQLQNKIRSEGVDPDYSVGAFSGDKLCGFILHANDIVEGRKTVYNAGTGVIPAYRKQGLTKRMYDFILPSLIDKETDRLDLEVITENLAAIRSYERSGFKTKRKLLCFKGATEPLKNETVKIKEMHDHNWDQLKTFWDFIPTWQNSVNVVERSKHANISYGAFINDQLAGYIIFNPLSKRVSQFGVDRKYRRQKIGSTLFNKISESGSSISVINVDEASEATISFLKKLGLTIFIEQSEMQLELK